MISGGAGFVGSNLAQRLLAMGERVVILDNLSRPGVEENVAWLKAMHGSGVELEMADVRGTANVRAVIDGAHSVFHFAAQVAVTTSLCDPVTDFEVIVRQPLPVDDPRQRRPDITLAQQLLSFMPRISFDEGLPRTAEYFEHRLRQRRALLDAVGQ